MSEKPFPPPHYVLAESALPGFTVYQPAAVAEPEQQTHVQFDCPQCSGATAFNAADGGLTCTYCGYHEAAQTDVVGTAATEFEFTPEHVAQAAQGWGVSRKTLACQNCGVEINIPADSLTHTCPYCLSNNVIQQKAAQDALRPRFIIPFQVDDVQNQTHIQTWLAEGGRGTLSLTLNKRPHQFKLWRITPSELSKLSSIGSHFTAVYLPFWTFDSRLEVDWEAEVKFERTDSDGDTITYYRDASGHERKIIDDMLIVGTSRVDDTLLAALADYDLQGLVAYAPDYLAGLHAQAYDVSLTEGWDSGRQKMRQLARAACVQEALKPSKAKSVRNLTMQVSFFEESWRYVLLPVYLGVYHYQNETYQVLVNGQTGTVSGRMPVDWPRVWLHVVLFFLPTLFLLVGSIALIPFGAGCILFPFGLAALVFSISATKKLITEAKALEQKASHDDDLGGSDD